MASPPPEHEQKEPPSASFRRDPGASGGTGGLCTQRPLDMGVLASSIATYGLPTCTFAIGDTVPLSVKLWPNLENHKLNTVAEALGFDFHHHQALDDARACAYIVHAALTKIPLFSEELLKETGQPLRTFSIDRMKKKLIFK